MEKDEIKAEVNELFKIWLTVHDELQTKKHYYEMKEDDVLHFMNMMLEEQYRDKVTVYLSNIVRTMESVEASVWKMANPTTDDEQH